MPLSYTLTDEKDYLLCSVSGEYDSNNSQTSIDFFTEVLGQCRPKDEPRVLVNMKDTVGYPSATERIIFYESIIDQYKVYLKFGGAPLRIVFLVNENKTYEYNPGLDVAEVREFPASIETDHDKAVDWLLAPNDKAS